MEAIMKALILYRSHFGNTRQVAEEIGRRLEATGHQAEACNLRQSIPNLSAFDLVLIGAPTRMARAGWRAMFALRRLRRMGIGTKPLAVFDTYGPVPTDPEKLQESQKWLYPGAAGKLADRARKLGLNVHAQVLRCEVKEMKGPLKEGELEKVASFVNEFAATAGK
jgi:flavorubredoxin